MLFFSFFFFNDTATTEIYTLSLHDALPILEPHLELARIEVVPLHPRRVAIGPNVAGGADFGVELRLAALASHELRAAGGVAPDPAGVGARRGRGGGAQPGERRVGRWLGGRRTTSELRPYPVQPRLERPDLRR